MQLIDVLSADDVRQIHLAIFRDLGAEYLRSGPIGGMRRREVEQRIRNVQDSKVRRNLRAVAAFDMHEIQAAWSHHMAIWAGTHLWPDANHRTAMAIFNYATTKAWGLQAVLDDAAAGAMRRESKKMRDADFLARHRYYTIEELSDPQHPYRQLFARYQDRLTLVAEIRQRENEDGR